MSNDHTHHNVPFDRAKNNITVIDTRRRGRDEPYTHNAGEIDPAKIKVAIGRKWCGWCGELLGERDLKTWVVTPAEMIQRMAGTVPMHAQCSRVYSNWMAAQHPQSVFGVWKVAQATAIPENATWTAETNLVELQYPLSMVPGAFQGIDFLQTDLESAGKASWGVAQDAIRAARDELLDSERVTRIKDDDLRDRVIGNINMSAVEVLNQYPWQG